MRKKYPAGKLPPDVLDRLLARIRARDHRLLVGPRFGEDAAVIDMGNHYLVAKSDPITFTAEHLGWYAVNINANDVAAMGARPRWFLAVLLLPEHRTDGRFVATIFQDILAACQNLSITLCGGHTEITTGLERPILVGHLLGEARKDELVLKSRLRAGDSLVLTKGIAIEGTAILAREKAAQLKRHFSAAFLGRARNFITRPGISVVREALAAARTADVHAMHDPTEGGLAGGLVELAVAGGVGLRVWADRIPILPETRALARHLGFDPMALIASGALLVGVAARDARKLVSTLKRRKIAAEIIGEVLPKKFGTRIVENGRERKLRYPRQDEIARLLASAPKRRRVRR